MQSVIARKKVENNDLNFEIVKVSPQMAQQWLDTNVKNRKLKKTFVTRLANDIKDGHWRITGEAIKFGTDGSLLDGQHRLAACVAANLPITTFVVYGVPNEVQDVMDSGVPRTAGDALTMRAIANANNVAAACRLLYTEKRGIVPYGGGSAERATTLHILSILKKHERLPLYVPYAGQIPRGISVPMVGYVRYVASTFCGKAIDADAMMNVLHTGVPSYEGDAIHSFREKIIRANIDLSMGSANRATIFKTFKSCWNRFVRQEPIHVLRWNKDDVQIDGLDLKDL